MPLIQCSQENVFTQDTVKQIEALADDLTANKEPGGFKKAIVKGIPRQAVLKPSHAVYRLQNQHFALGDRVTMVQDSGGVPLSFKGVVIGMNAKSMDVVWDAAFMSGTTLGDRYDERSFFSCLLTDIVPQVFAVSWIYRGILVVPEPHEPPVPRIDEPEGTNPSTTKGSVQASVRAPSIGPTCPWRAARVRLPPSSSLVRPS